MPRPEIPILIVDDAKFSNKVIGKTISSGGYSNVRYASSAPEALQLLEEEPADILVADWLMPEMDGLELAQRVRQLDEASNHYTYVVLLTAREGDEALSKAFQEGVDDFVNKSEMGSQLLPRIHAAQRSADNLNRLLAENQRLLEANRKLRNLSTMDPLTGLGNLRFAIKALRDTLRHAESREGAACYLLIHMQNFSDIQQKYSRDITDQISLGVARRLRQLVRPLDNVVRISTSDFAVIMHVEDSQHCTAASFRRILEGLNGKEFKSTAGFIPVNTAISVSYADAASSFPDSEAMMTHAKQHLREAIDSGRLVVEAYRPAD